MKFLYGHLCHGNTQQYLAGDACWCLPPGDQQLFPLDTNAIFLNTNALYDFSQSKTVAAISRPLVSSGSLGLNRHSELIWQTRQPLKSTMVISTRGLRQYNRDDALINDITTAAVTEIAQLFLDLLSGNTSKLAGSFDQRLHCHEDGHWQLDLIPQKPALRKLLLSLALTGAGSLETISFQEPAGDSTKILLSPAPANRLAELASYLGD